MPSDRLSRRGLLTALSVSAAGVAGCQSGLLPDRSRPAADTPEPFDGESYEEVYDDVSTSVADIRVYSDYGGSQGSGFLYDDSHIVTNEHVVAAGDTYHVRFSDTDWKTASVVGTDVYSDLAVLAIDNPPSSATPLSFVNSEPSVGSRVIAIGNPFGLSGSVSKGIVSGLDRTLEGTSTFSIPAGIQTDAAVNPGNSGGPLINLEGGVVGVINSGGGDNVGFAISGLLGQRVVPELIRDGSYDHPYLGATLRSVTPTISQANNLDEASGVYVDEIASGSPAKGVLEESSGTQLVNGVRTDSGGDVIHEFNDTSVETQQDLVSELLFETSPGDSVDIRVQRDGQREYLDLTLGIRPES